MISYNGKLYELAIIVACDNSGLIGNKNSLPWKLKEDLDYFKLKTRHHALLMGRKTYESLPKHLQDRDMIVISSQNIDDPKITLAKTFETGLLTALERNPNIPMLFVIGGKALYEYSLPYSDILYMTKIEKTYSGDTYWPGPLQPEKEGWTLKAKQGPMVSNASIPYSFLTYQQNSVKPLSF